MMPDDDALQAFLAQQCAEYRASLPSRLARLEQALASVEDAGMHALERCAHEIAGSAATFGLRELGQVARTLEDACEARAPEVPSLAEALRARLRQEIGTG